MEMDYYDYNVANAGAAPGSYLGMDPAFLLWIPPLSMSEDFEDPSADRPDCFQGTTTTSPLYRLPESTEGATLTPAEYRRIRQQLASSIEETRLCFEQKHQDSTSSSSSKNDSSSGSGNTSEDSISSESRAARLNERLLPIHRILEDSRTRVSEESLCGQLVGDRTSCVIPNRLHVVKSDFSQEQDISKSSRQSSYANISDSVLAKSDDKLEKSKQTSKKYSIDVAFHHGPSKSHVNQKAKDISQEDKKNRFLKNDNTSKFPSKTTSSKTQVHKDVADGKDNLKSDNLLTNLNVTDGQCKYRDFTQFTQPCEAKLSDCTNIPMIEFSGPRLGSPATARRLTTDNLNTSLKMEIQSPDYGVESDIKAESRESFYDLIGENENGIKFADDDDEYIDNRANL